MTTYPKISLGTWSWGVGAIGGDQIFGNSLSAADLKAVFDEAMKNGLNLFDTATAYGLGASEDILGELMRGYPRESVLISTKFTPQLAERYDNSVEKMCEASCRRFGTDYIDLYWIHNPLDVERWTPGLIPLLKSGRVKSVGVSNHNLAQLKRANEILGAEGFRVQAVQNHYSLLYRSSERAGILDFCKQNDIRFLAYMVLEQGALSGRYDTHNPMPPDSARGATYNGILPQLEALTQEMREIGKAHDANVSQIAQAWAVNKGTIPIIGVTRTRHIADTVRAADIVLSADEMARLEAKAEEAGVDTKGSWENPMEG